jgi:hypothetical protein
MARMITLFDKAMHVMSSGHRVFGPPHVNRKRGLYERADMRTWVPH